MTRDELVEAIALKRGITKKATREIVDAVLDEVRRQVLPVVESEWCGGEVMRRIEALRGDKR